MSDNIPTVLSDADRRTIAAVFNGMPYGYEAWGTAHLADFKTFDDVLTGLSQLAATLEGAERRRRLLERDLEELVKQRAAIRAFLGTGG